MAVYMPRTVERDGRLRPPYDFDDQDEMEDDADELEDELEGDDEEDEEDDEDEDDDYGIGKPSKLRDKNAKHQYLRNPATR